PGPPHVITVVSKPMVESAPCVKSLPDQSVQATCPVDGLPTAVQVDEKASV
ncbi:hypothetical protein A2U01_0117498, partial [Trifolium medium]|nr:hypothetical protein [Trifolium medium]